MISTREVKAKMRTTKNIREITSALEVVSIIRMKKSQEVVKQSKNFVKTGFEILKSLLENGALEGSDNKKEKTDNKKAVLLITSDKGLCGPFNVNVVKKFNEFLGENNFTEKDIKVISVGKWGYNFLKRKNFNILSSFQRFSDVITLEEINPIAENIFDLYSKGEFSELYVVYTDFISSVKNVCRVKRMLPYNVEEVINIIKEVFPEIEYKEKEKKVKKEYIFEPSVSYIMQRLTPFLLRIQLFYFITESNAVEHSLRMMAMRNAKDTATDFLKSLNLIFNKARQEKITSELIEITSAKELL